MTGCTGRLGFRGPVELLLTGVSRALILDVQLAFGDPQSAEVQSRLLRLLIQYSPTPMLD